MFVQAAIETSNVQSRTCIFSEIGTYQSSIQFMQQCNTFHLIYEYYLTHLF